MTNPLDTRNLEKMFEGNIADTLDATVSRISGNRPSVNGLVSQGTPIPSALGALADVLDGPKRGGRG